MIIEHTDASNKSLIDVGIVIEIACEHSKETALNKLDSILLNYSEVEKLKSTKFWVLCGLGQTYISASKCWITFRLISEDTRAATYVT